MTTATRCWSKADAEEPGEGMDTLLRAACLAESIDPISQGRRQQRPWIGRRSIDRGADGCDALHCHVAVASDACIPSNRQQKSGDAIQQAMP